MRTDAFVINADAHLVMDSNTLSKLPSKVLLRVCENVDLKDTKGLTKAELAELIVNHRKPITLSQDDILDKKAFTIDVLNSIAKSVIPGRVTNISESRKDLVNAIITKTGGSFDVVKKRCEKDGEISGNTTATKPTDEQVPAKENEEEAQVVSVVDHRGCPSRTPAPQGTHQPSQPSQPPVPGVPLPPQLTREVEQVRHTQLNAEMTRLHVQYQRAQMEVDRNTILVAGMTQYRASLASDPRNDPVAIAIELGRQRSVGELLMEQDNPYTAGVERMLEGFHLGE